MSAKETGLPTEERYAPPERVRDGALVESQAAYTALYERSINDREAFWSEMATEHLDWMSPFTTVVDDDLAT
jgi:acetyl-CoA synthetase